MSSALTHPLLRGALYLLTWGLLAWGCSDELPPSDSTACTQSADCPGGRSCDRGVCVLLTVCAGDDPECTCRDDLECAAGLICDQATRSCVTPMCDETLDCRLGERCVSGRCVVDTDADRDRDGVPDQVDVCPDTPDTDQRDTDGDAQGDVCDRDDDNDGVLDALDVCPLTPDPAQHDNDGDGVGNACDPEWRGVTLRARLVSPLSEPTWSESSVTLMGEAGSQLATIQPGGLLEVPGLEPGLLALEASVPGHLPLSRVLQVPADMTVWELGDVALTPEFATSSAVALTGRARRGDVALGEDQSGILVHVRIDETLIASTLTDPQGDFVVALSRDDAEVSFSQQGYQTLTAAVRWEEGAETFVTGPEDTPTSRFDGFVLSPVATATLTGQLTSPLPEIDDWSSRAVVTLLREQTQRLALVQPDGRFQATGLRPGAWSLLINARGHQVSLLDAVLLSEGDNALPEIALTPEQVALSGSLRWGDTLAPAAGITVRVLRDRSIADVTLSDQEGRFTAQVTPEGHTLELSGEGVLGRSVEVRWSEGSFQLPAQGDVGLERTPLLLNRDPASDRDADGVLDSIDNCPDIPNPLQENIDIDRERPEERRGDACDEDKDEDGLVNGLDTCPGSFNPSQEDPDGDGLGVVCSDPPEGPAVLGCGVQNQHVNTQERPDTSRGSCGGVSAPDVTYRLFMEAGEEVDIRVAAAFDLAIYLIHADSDVEQACALSNVATFRAARSGEHLLVIDGAAPGLAGALRVDITKASCQPTLQEVTDYTGLPQMSDAISADFNGDGWADLAVTSDVAPEVAILLGDGRGGYSQAQRYGLTRNGYALAAGDLNRDGHVDLIASVQLRGGSGEGVNVLLGRGDGTLQPPRWYAAQGWPSGVALADLNTDGVLDVVTAHRYGSDTNNPDDGFLGVFLGRGDGTLQAVRYVETGGEPVSVYVADFDDDGRQDLIAFSLELPRGSLGEASVIALRSRGDGTFDAPQRSTLPYLTQAMRVGDLDGDGELEGVTLSLYGSFSGTGDTMTVYALGEDGRLTDPEVLPQGLELPGDLTLAELNGDGLLDIAVSETRSNTLWTLINQGDGTFREARYRTGIGPTRVLALDANNDGLLDLATGNYSGGSISTLLGRGAGRFEGSTRIFTGGTRPFGFTVADLDQDGVPDLAATSLYSASSGDQTSYDSKVIVRFGVGPCGEDGRCPGDPGYTGPDHGEGAGWRSGMDPARLDAFSGEAAVVPGPTLVLGSTGPGAGVVAPYAIQSGDLNGDALPDLVIANILSQGVGGTLSVRLGAPGRAFTARPDIDLGSSVLSVIIAELNGDDSRDLAAVTSSGQLVLLAGDGAGSFVEARRYGAEGGPRHLQAEDLNGDTRADLIVVASDTDRVMVYMAQDGSFDFSPPMTYEVGDQPNRVAARDLNRDGIPDLAVANTNSNNVALLFGRGDGTFSPAIFLPVGRFPQGLLVEDINQDGLVDLITANSSDDTLSVLWGQGDGSFQEAATLRAGDSPLHVESADLDGDGAKELLIALANREIAVIFNDPQRRAQRREVIPTAGVPTDLQPGLPGRAVRDLWVAQQSPDQVGTFALADGEVLQRAAIALPSAPTRLERGDLNGDGRSDVVALMPASNSIAVLLGRADGTLSAPQCCELTGSTCGPPAPGWPSCYQAPVDPSASGLGLGLRDLALQDVNGDQLDDLFVLGSSSGRVFVLRSQEDGTLAGPVALPLLYGASQRAVGVEAGDLNGDGIFEAIVAHDFGVVEWVALHPLNEGSSLCRTGCDLIYSPRRMVDIALEELGAGAERDSTPELLLISESPSELLVYPNLGAGPDVRFGLQRATALDGTPKRLIVGDLQGDGEADVMISLSAPETLALLSNRGAGFFEAPRPIPVGSGPQGLALVDLDGDGAPEVLSADLNERTLTWVHLGAVRREEAGTHLLDAALESCPTRAVEATLLEGEARFALGAGAGCRIERVEIEVPGVAITSATLQIDALRGASPVVLLPTSSQTLLRPEETPELARFEGAPARGVWTLRTAQGTQAILHLNRFPEDPRAGLSPCREFAPMLPEGAACTIPPAPGEGALGCAAPEALCGLRLVAGERHRFALAGPLRGGLTANQSIAWRLEAAPGTLRASIVAGNAPQALARSVEVEPGVWEVRWRVDPRYAERYLTLEISAQDAQGTDYDLLPLP